MPFTLIVVVNNSSDSPDESDTLTLTGGEVLGVTDALPLTDGSKLGDAVDGPVKLGVIVLVKSVEFF